MSRASLTRRGLLAVGATIPFSGCLGMLTGMAGNNVPSSVPADLTHESLGVATDEDSIDIVTDGELTLVYFFATWCGPCEPQLETLHEIREEYDPETLSMRAISPEDDEELVADYWADNDVDWPGAIDPESDLHSEFGVSVYPSLVLVDPDGDVRWSTSGTADFDEITDQIDSELESA
ncbi:TlpA family protein disulfide reductase [Salinadaptatus halalkaliphilus]|uniref:TlpA family protein disulfide reductase n=1 Tax=Salinadaptatus halalkaliphilus TaxID=2419781 RepID=A0A4S3TG41_9EURY|nr:TlpA disulfide reductase family protein [Salinadaptatus halalkaliphilus]THE62816.1 TlpA family protein disulfide reductase [Salinadaptatus halalkaliphilus]